VSWVELAQDRVHCRVLVLLMLNLPVFVIRASVSVYIVMALR